MLEILRVGPLSLVQDLGRHGLRHLGIARGGALDTLALRRANALLGNAPGAAALELVAGPLELRCARDAWFALCGAEFEITLDGRPLRSEWRWPMRAGQLLRVQGPLRGQRGLLAFDGGLDLPLELGARATDLRAGFGGLQGRALKRGDRLPLGTARTLHGVRGLRAPECEPQLRLLPGPELALMSAAARKRFWAQDWTISPQSDRMGARLLGESLAARALPELPSHAVVPGLVQLPPGGQPIVLLTDAQTTGGYPRLGCVIEADLWKLAQWRPGQALRFVESTLDEALAARALQERELELLAWRASI